MKEVSLILIDLHLLLDLSCGKVTRLSCDGLSPLWQCQPRVQTGQFLVLLPSRDVLAGSTRSFVTWIERRNCLIPGVMRRQAADHNAHCRLERASASVGPQISLLCLEGHQRKP